MRRCRLWRSLPAGYRHPTAPHKGVPLLRSVPFPFPVHLLRRKTGLNYRIPTSLLKRWMRLFFHIRHRFIQHFINGEDHILPVIRQYYSCCFTVRQSGKLPVHRPAPPFHHVFVVSSALIFNIAETKVGDLRAAPCRKVDVLR